MNEPRSRRGGAGKVPLTRCLIVETALGIITEQDFDALTMRSLAQELSTGPAALYVYFSNRQSLVDALADNVLSDVEILDPEDDMTWNEQLEILAMCTVDSLRKFPNLGTRMVGRVPSADALLHISEAYLQILIDSGHDETTSVLAVDALTSVVITEANEIPRFETTAGEDHLDEAESALSGLNPEKFLLLNSNASSKTDLLSRNPGSHWKW